MNRKLIERVSLIIIVIGLFFLARVKTPSEVEEKTHRASAVSSTKTEAMKTAALEKGKSRAPGSLAKPPAGKKDSAVTQSAKKYFHEHLETIPAVDNLFRATRGRLPPGAASELLSMYIAESIARNATPEFAQFMQDLHASLRENSEELADLISERENTLKEDPFIYQMTLNLAAHLDLSGEDKARLLGSAMTIHFETDSRMGVSPMSTNITNALILMKNYGVTAAQAAPYIQSGIATNRDNPKALAEFAARANTYFPGSVTGF
jgi:hypothetical protein